MKKLNIAAFLLAIVVAAPLAMADVNDVGTAPKTDSYAAQASSDRAPASKKNKAHKKSSKKSKKKKHHRN